MAIDVNKVKFFRLTPTDEYLDNPHKGCCTFQRFNGDALLPGVDWTIHEQGPLKFPESTILQKGPHSLEALEPLVVNGYLPTTVAYCRWFWNVLEPKPGEYDFTMIDKSLEICKERGQTLAVRLMPFGHFASGQPYLPEWYENTGAPMQSFRGWDKRVPIYDSEEYFKLWGDLIKEFGHRYDSNPLLESIDVAYLGPWGEGDGECSQERCDSFAELWDRTFPHTHKLSLTAAMRGDQFKAGIQKGFGWRADSFGDMRQSRIDSIPMDEGWNHMYNVYPRRVAEAGAFDAWKTAPVHFEVSFVPMTWYHKKFDIDFIIQQGLKYHATYFMPKSTKLPSAWVDKLAKFSNDIGYKFIFRQAVIDKKVKLGDQFDFEAWIENAGVAPIYHKYDFAIRLRQDEHKEIIVVDDQDVRKWLPGDIWFEKKILCPSYFRTGMVEVSVGLIDHKTKDAKVNFAVKERFCDRWTLLGNIEIAK